MQLVFIFLILFKGRVNVTQFFLSCYSLLLKIKNKKRIKVTKGGIISIGKIPALQAGHVGSSPISSNKVVLRKVYKALQKTTNILPLLRTSQMLT